MVEILYISLFRQKWIIWSLSTCYMAGSIYGAWPAGKMLIRENPILTLIEETYCGANGESSGGSQIWCAFLPCDFVSYLEMASGI